MRDPQQWMVCKGKTPLKYIKMDDLGVPLFQETLGNPHMLDVGTHGEAIEVHSMSSSGWFSDVGVS